MSAIIKVIMIAFQLIIFSQMMSPRPAGNRWSVKYNQKSLCVLNGSTVFMNGKFTHPAGLTVTQMFWFIKQDEHTEPTDLREEAGYPGRVKYSTDEQNRFSLSLSDVKKSDEHVYYLRIKINNDKGNWEGEPGVTLNVTELRVEAPDKVMEGNQTVLVCNTTCSLSDTSGFNWYKNDLIINTSNTNGNTLTLQRVEVEDAGNYKCAVRDHGWLRSPALSLRVRYPPKNVSVSISPSGRIMKGNSVTLTCSSVADPPVNCSWFKERSLVGKEKTFTISKISSENSGAYKCKCSNEFGHRYSSSVTLNPTESQGGRTMKNAVIGVTVIFLCSLLLVFILVFLRREKATNCWSKACDVHNAHAANHPPLCSSRSATQNEVQYVSIKHQRKAKDSAAGSSERVLYAKIQHPRDKARASQQQDDAQHTQHVSSSHQRTVAGASENTSIIYSTVK